MTQQAYELRSDDTSYGDPPSIDLLDDIHEVESALHSQTGGPAGPAFVPLELRLRREWQRRSAAAHRLAPRLFPAFEVEPDLNCWLSALADELVTPSSPGIRRRDQALAAMFAAVRAALFELSRQRYDRVETANAGQFAAIDPAETIPPPAEASHARAAAEVRALAGLTVERVASMLGVAPKSYYRWLHGEPISDDHRSQLHYLHALLSDVARRLDSRSVADWLLRPIYTTPQGPVTPLQLLQAGRFQEVYDHVTALPDPHPVRNGVARGLLPRAPANTEDWG